MVLQILFVLFRNHVKMVARALILTVEAIISVNVYLDLRARIVRVCAYFYFNLHVHVSFIAQSIYPYVIILKDDCSVKAVPKKAIKSSWLDPRNPLSKVPYRSYLYRHSGRFLFLLYF